MLRPTADTNSIASETASESSFQTASDVSQAQPDDRLTKFFPGINNPKRHLLHNGKWIPKQFEVGRPVKRTGMWSCCGHPVHYSLYCESIERRDIFKKMIADEIAAEKSEFKGVEARKNFLADEIQRIQPVDTSDLPVKPDATQSLMSAAQSPSLGFNAPMLIQWIARHNKEEVTMVEGLEFVLFHLQSGEGCVLLHKHQALETIFNVYGLYRSQQQIQQLIAQILRQFVDCNFTRDDILQKHVIEIVGAAFAIAHQFMNSAAHVEPACRVLMQCARHPTGTKQIFTLNAPAYLISFAARRYMKSVEILQSVLTLLSWLAGDQAAMRYLFRLKALNFATKVMRLHPTQPKLLVPAINLLYRLCLHVPEAMEQILNQRVAALVVDALRRIYADREVTLTALRLLQTISRTSQGFEQLNGINNAWQIMAQGTLAGDALVHRLPGPFQNPGWALGDTPFLPELDRQKLKAKENLSNSLQVASRDWTVSSLRQYMGQSMEGQTLAINREKHEVFFDLIVTLDLLPRPGEEKEQWFVRLREFEYYNDLQLEEMVLTVQEMRRRDSMNRDLARQGVRRGEAEGMGADGEAYLGSVKPIYVNGEVITTQLLEDRDQALNEALQF